MTASIVRHGSLHLKRKLKSNLEREGGRGREISKYVRKKQTLCIDILKILIEKELTNHHTNEPLVSTKKILIVSPNIKTI